MKWSRASEWGKLDWNNNNEEEFKETDEKICKTGKNKIAGSEMQETVEEEWKAETREKEGKREGKEEWRKKSGNYFIYLRQKIDLKNHLQLVLSGMTLKVLDMLSQMAKLFQENFVTSNLTFHDINPLDLIQNLKNMLRRCDRRCWNFRPRMLELAWYVEG